MLCFTQRAPIFSSSDLESTLPMGLWGEFRTIILVLELMVFSKMSKSIVQFEAEEVL